MALNDAVTTFEVLIKMSQELPLMITQTNYSIQAVKLEEGHWINNGRIKVSGRTKGSYSNRLKRESISIQAPGVCKARYTRRGHKESIGQRRSCFLFQSVDVLWEFVRTFVMQAASRATAYRAPVRGLVRLAFRPGTSNKYSALWLEVLVHWTCTECSC